MSYSFFDIFLKDDQLSKVKTFQKKLRLTKIVLPILSQLRVTKVNIIKKFWKENSKITSHRLKYQKEREKSLFLFVSFVHLNGHPIANLT